MYPKVFEEFKEFTLKYGDLSTLPTRYFLAKPPVGEEIAVPIDQGKTLLIKLVAVSPVNTVTGMREVLFEVRRAPLLLVSPSLFPLLSAPRNED